MGQKIITTLVFDMLDEGHRSPRLLDLPESLDRSHEQQNHFPIWFITPVDSLTPDIHNIIREIFYSYLF